MFLIYYHAPESTIIGKKIWGSSLWEIILWFFTCPFFFLWLFHFLTLSFSSHHPNKNWCMPNACPLLRTSPHHPSPPKSINLRKMIFFLILFFRSLRFLWKIFHFFVVGDVQEDIYTKIWGENLAVKFVLSDLLEALGFWRVTYGPQNSTNGIHAWLGLPSYFGDQTAPPHLILIWLCTFCVNVSHLTRYIWFFYIKNKF